MEKILALKEVEQIIERCAARFKIPGSEFEDLVQVGRIAVWKMLAKRTDITEQTFKDHAGLIWQMVEFALKNEVTASGAKKRLILNNAGSIDVPVGDGQTLASSLLGNNQTDDFTEITDGSMGRQLLKKLEIKAIRQRSRENTQAVIWLFVHLLDIKRKEIPKKLIYPTFIEYGLGRFLWVFFNNSPSRAVHYAYPGEFYRHEMVTPLRYWKGVRGKKRAKKVLREILEQSGYEPEMYPKLMTNSFLEEFRLVRPWSEIYGWDRFAYLNDVFPGKYEPWEFSYTPKNFFENLENVKRAVRWLVEKKLGYDMEAMDVHEVWKNRIALKITKNTFSDYGLSEIIHNYPSPEKPLRMTYPDKFLDWSFQSKKKWVGESGKQLAARATRWLIEEHCKIPKISQEITWKFFVDQGFNGMISAKSLGFNSSPRKTMENAYPHLKMQKRV